MCPVRNVTYVSGRSQEFKGNLGSCGEPLAALDNICQACLATRHLTTDGHKTYILLPLDGPFPPEQPQRDVSTKSKKRIKEGGDATVPEHQSERAVPGPGFRR